MVPTGAQRQRSNRSRRPGGGSLRRAVPFLIEEIYPGSYAHPDAQYIVLRSVSLGQNVLVGQPMLTWDASGNPLANFGEFDRNSPNNANGAHYIMATQAAVDLFQFTATTIVDGRLPFPDGRVCFAPFLADCVAYGAFAGNNAPWGTPTAAMALQKALKRIRTVSPHNNSTDYNLGAPRPTDELNLVRPDDDGDGIPNIGDCASTNVNVYLKPFEAAHLLVNRVPDGLGGFTTTVVSDDQDLAVGPATVYDLIVRELISPAIPAPWTTATCRAPNLATAGFTDTSIDPQVGNVRLYLARAQDVCADGTYGNYNPGSIPSPPPDPPDPLDGTATTPCP